MNKIYVLFVVISGLALAPACKKEKKTDHKKRVKVQMNPLDNTENKWKGAISRDDFAKIQELAEAHPELINIPHDRYSALGKALTHKKHDLALYLIDHGAEIDYSCTPYNDTPLMVAAKYGDLDIVEKLLDKDANVNYGNINGETALMQAALGCHSEIVDKLITADAHVDAIDKHGENAYEKSRRASLRPRPDHPGRLVRHPGCLAICKKLKDLGVSTMPPALPH